MKKKILLSLAFFMPFIFCGCMGKVEYSDPSVNMKVREIMVAENTPATEMLNEAKSAVVGIMVSYGDGYAIGSGVAIEEGGYILTNYHVVEDGKSITLYYADKTMGKASYIWGDSGLDLAIIKSSKNIPYLSVGTEENVVVGEDIYAIGTPLTLQFKHTITKGIVSATGRTIEVESENGTSFLQSLIQHDASINAGNSGGALINSKGQVVGINTLKAVEGEGIGFAIPIDIGESVMNQIVKNEAYMEPYLGVFGFDSDIAELYGENIARAGVYVVSVDGPAKEVGLQKGDIITSIGGQRVENVLDLRIALFNYKPNDKVNVSYLRNNSQKTTEVLLSSK